jgi:hypothetical protein
MTSAEKCEPRAIRDEAPNKATSVTNDVTRGR